MQRGDSQRQGPGGAAPTGCESFLLPSRRAALETCLAGMSAGPVLITGEAGSGKSWLASRLAAEAPAPRRWASVDVAPTLGAGGLVRAIGHRLGLEPAVADRLSLADALADETADGRRWGLIVDEVHLAPAEILEELRVLSNGLGRPDGLGALVLVGQSSLLRRLATRPLQALAARLTARAHLRPLDADEAGVLVDRLAPGQALDEVALEALHRDAWGNPRLLLRLVATESAGGAPARVPVPLADDVPRPSLASLPPLGLASGPAPKRPPANPDPSDSDEMEPLVGAGLPELPRFTLSTSRPPLLEEDGMIEVGWESSEDEPAEVALSASSIESPSPFTGPSEESAELTESEPPPTWSASTERIDDHYAALQAWQEWSRNQQHSASATATFDEAETTSDSGSPEPRPGTASGLPGDSGRPEVWAEGQQTFAPYGQLFSQAREPRDSDG